MNATDEGNITILALASMTTIAMAMMLALEFSCVFVQKLAIDNDLNIAREETFGPGFDMQLKNSADPGTLIASTIARSLNRNGFSGDCTVWFYEASEDELLRAQPQLKTAKNVRALAFCVSTSQRRSSIIIPSQWLEDINLQSSTSAIICPYALYETYRPAGAAGKLVKFQIRDGAVASAREEPFETAPAMMATAVESSIEKASATAVSNM